MLGSKVIPIRAAYQTHKMNKNRKLRKIKVWMRVYGVRNERI